MKIVKTVIATIGISVCFLYLGCGSVPIEGVGIPTISQIVPYTLPAGSSGVTVKVVGSNFTNQTIVLWNGSPLATTFIDDKTVASPVGSASLAVPGTAELQVQNGVTGQVSASMGIAITSSPTAPPALSIVASLLPAGVVGTPYSTSVSASGGTPAYTWSIASGSLPAGMSLAASSGAISGTPTTMGTFTFVIAVSDAGSPVQTETSSMTIVVAASPLTIATLTLPSGTALTGYSTTLQAGGGTPAYTWSITAGALPAGLALTRSTGVISGTPTAGGVSNITVAVSDSSNPTQIRSAAMTIVIAPAPLRINTSSLPAATGGTAYSQILQASGGTPAYRWSISSGSLPAGMNLQPSTGVISGMPTTGGSSTFTTTVSDSGNPVQAVSTPMTVTVIVTPSSLTITTSTLPADTVGTSYSQTLQATGGTAPYSWSISSGQLPAGLSIAAPTGVISGTPTASGTFGVTAKVTDSGNPVQTTSVALSLVVTPSALTITTSALPSGTASTSYSTTLRASGGTPGYTWSITSGGLPGGLTLAAATGVISGAPTGSGTSNFTVNVSDNGNPTQTKSAAMSLIVAPSTLTITTSALPSGTASTSYSTTLRASGGTPGYTWSTTSGSLPAGLTLAAATGIISGAPTGSGTSNFTVNVSDSGNPTQTKSAAMSLTVAPSTLTITTSALPSGTASTSYSTTLRASGGTPGYTWSITSGSLPGGLTLAAATGVISGAPTGSGTSSFTATVSDSSSPAQTSSTTISLVVASGTLTIAAPSLPSGTVGTAYSTALQVSGGTPAYTWSITSGSLPAGLTLAATTGVISGMPTASGSSSFTATVHDNGSPIQTQSVQTSIILSAAQAAGHGTTWFVRADGGTRYSANVTTGQCNGKADAAYPGTGTNQNCAFNDFRYMWDDDSGVNGNEAWVMAGGDTVVIRGCHALPGQQNPANPDCRLGWDINSGGGSSNNWCPDIGPYTCFNVPIPSGTSGAHTKILGGCAYDGSCTPINNNFPYGTTNETQLFGGMAQTWSFNLGSTQYVDIAGIELTTHNGVCVTTGFPAWPRNCVTSPPVDDFANNGFLFNNTSANITFTDVYVHGFSASGMYGPIGGPISMTRVFIGFNGFAGDNFADTSDTPDAAGSSINAQYVTMSGNGCNEQYPIANTSFPAQACYDSVSNGFGDSWSGQDTELDSFICNHCVNNYNTKDGFIGPHTQIGNLQITNSTWIGNMGTSVKFAQTQNATLLFQNNLVNYDCTRMSLAVPGAVQNFALSTGLNGSYLSNYCRAGSEAFAQITRSGSNNLYAGNTVIAASTIIFEQNCGYYSFGNVFNQETNCGSVPIVYKDNNFTGYTIPGQDPPALYYAEPAAGALNFTASFTNETGLKGGTTDTCGVNNITCVDPALLNAPAQPWPSAGLTGLDVFNPLLANNSFYPTPSSSPLIGAGTPVNGLTTDYYGVTRASSPTMGAVEP